VHATGATLEVSTDNQYSVHLHAPYICIQILDSTNHELAKCGDAVDFEQRERDRSELGRFSTSLGAVSCAQHSGGLPVLSCDFTDGLHYFHHVQGSLLLLLVQSPGLVADLHRRMTYYHLVDLANF
jgi:hypothetical protein